ncbi:hypothetical protein [Runella sp.]
MTKFIEFADTHQQTQMPFPALHSFSSAVYAMVTHPLRAFV